MEQAGGILQRIVAQTVAASLQRLPAEELPQAAWDFAAGQAVAQKTRVLGFELSREVRGEAKTLRIEVADANWLAQLSAMAPQYVARLKPYLAVERIEFQLAGAAESPRGRSPQRAKAKKPQPASQVSAARTASRDLGHPTESQQPPQAASKKPKRAESEEKGTHEGHGKGRSLRRRSG